MNNDFELYFLLFRLHLKETKEKIYSENCDTNLVYVFENYCEFREYFTDNGYDSITFDEIEFCKIKTLGNGKVVAYKHLCDKLIKKNKNKVLKKSKGVLYE